MRFVVSIILVTFIFSSIHPIHEKIQFSLDEKVNLNFKNSLGNGGDSQSSNINVKAMMYSAILPGAGEYSMGHTNRAYLFLGIEALAIGIWYMYNQKGLDTQDEYRAFADEYWSMERWFSSYYNFADQGYDQFSADNYNIFTKDEDCNDIYFSGILNSNSSCYPNIWEDSHHLNFSINGNYYSSNSDEFETFYIINELSDEVMAEIFFENNLIAIEKDHHYYENIGKYDHFFAGWEDNDALYLVVKENGGEDIAMSPYKKHYRETWNNSNDYYNIASFALSSIVANHFASMMDVLILSKLSNNKITNLSAKTYFSPLNPYGIGGIKLSFNWN